jgi:hypothetical protein
VIGPGQTGTVNARLAPMDITVAASETGPPIAGATVVAVSQNCGAIAEKTLSLGVTDASGQLKSSLPYGSWQLTATYASSTVQSDPFVTAKTGPTAVLVAPVVP